MKKALILETLHAWNQNTMAVHRLFQEDGNESAAHDCLIESMTLDSVIAMLSNNKNAREIRGIYFPEERS